MIDDTTLSLKSLRGRGEEVGVGRIGAAFEANGVVTFASSSPGVHLVAGDNF